MAFLGLGLRLSEEWCGRFMVEKMAGLPHYDIVSLPC